MWKIMAPLFADAPEYVRHFLIFEDRHDREFHQVAPHKSELSQDLRILALQELKAAAEIGAGPATQQFGSRWRLPACLSEPDDTLIAGPASKYMP
jgi:hypothetical protein